LASKEGAMHKRRDPRCFAHLGKVPRTWVSLKGVIQGGIAHLEETNIKGVIQGGVAHLEETNIKGGIIREPWFP